MPRAKKPYTILGIETSCDETSIAVVDCTGTFSKPSFLIRTNVVSSQAELHAKFGGVVPNLAKREHTRLLPTVLEEALAKANITNPSKEIDAIAVTVGPGLEPALWCGITFAQQLAKEWNLPVIAANHMEGHMATPLLHEKEKAHFRFPVLALLVSGGHTEIVIAKNWLDYKIVGQTLDDAAGEAFDKVARMMNLGYPGGPVISKLAETGNRYGFSFPRPMIHSKNFDFSFSGLKTAVLYTLRDLEKDKTPYSKNDIAASFEDAVIDVLLLKTTKAAREYKVKSIIIGGGVAANNRLRARMSEAFPDSKNTPRLFLSPPHLTGDNAAMIAAASYFHALKKRFTDWKKLKAHATLSL